MERHSPHDMTISKAGIAFIKRWEECRLTAYKDSGGVWTVGYGHTGSVHPRQVITPQQAEDLLRMDIFVAERAMRRHIEAPLSQDEYDATASFVYNVGEGQFERSTFLEMLNNLDYTAAADQLLRWCHDNGQVVQGLLNRRRDERLLFTGHYHAAS